MIMRPLKAFLLGITLVLLLTNGRAGQSADQDHSPLVQLSEALRRVITRVTPAVVTVETVGYTRSDDDNSDSANRAAVASVESLRSMMNTFSSGDSVVFQIERQRQFQYVPMDID